MESFMTFKVIWWDIDKLLLKEKENNNNIYMGGIIYTKTSCDQSRGNPEGSSTLLKIW